jgi:predicted nuclease with RNAse H fold
MAASESGLCLRMLPSSLLTRLTSVRTTGIDLAAQPARTAACDIEWRDDRATATVLANPQDDDSLLEVIARSDKAGIDCPFGWPEPFVDAMTAHRTGSTWPGRNSEDPDEFRAELAYRATDVFVAERAVQPLSVSTDKIGVTAMRCAKLLDELAARDQPVDRTGAGKVVEVYPAAALDSWGLTSRGYKRAEGLKTLGVLCGALSEQTPWLTLSGNSQDLCQSSDDCFDALICALVARAAALGQTEGPPVAEREQAKTEGWIHLPNTDSLALLNSR